MIRTGIHTYFIALLFTALTPAIKAQECPCCSEEYRQFDFWIGEWTVYDSAGTVAGTNSIARSQKGCLLTEDWTSASGNTGTSYNYFLKSDSTWNQVWIDDQGGVLELKGRYTGKAMVLQSELLTGTRIPFFYHRITWEEKNREVIQTWEILDSELRVKTVLFKGFYRKES